MKKLLPYPDNHAGDTSDVIFGLTVRDPYRWLENEKSPDVAAWVAAQDKLARSELKALPERDAIAARLKELMYVDVLTAPAHRGARWFYSRRLAALEKGIVYFKDGKTGAEKVLLDPNKWSEDGSTSLGNWSVSPDGKKVAYTIHQHNSDEATLKVLDIDSGKESDVIEGAKYAQASWTKDSRAFYYTWLPADGAVPTADRPGFADVRVHVLGTDVKGDTIVHEKTGDSSKFIGADVSEDGTTLFLVINQGWSGNELYVRDLRAGAKAPFVPLATGFKSHYSAIAFKGAYYILTDEGAPKWRIFKVDPKKPARADWVEIVKEDPDATLDGASILGGKLALTYLEKAASRLQLHALDGKKERTVELPGIGSVGGPMGREDEDEAYFSFESFTTPFEVHTLSMKTGATTLYSAVKVPIEKDKFVVEQVTFPSKDKTPVTMFIVHAKDFQKNGENRTLLYGYGGFQVSETPAFSSTIYPWLERGGVYAVANIRGGGEYGEGWHEAGMLGKKQNVFDDFIAAAEYLEQEKYTNPSRLAISGASNGGLLMGAVTAQRPDLFSAVLCGVPLLDMVRYEKFGAGKTWAAEYGSAERRAGVQVALRLFAVPSRRHGQEVPGVPHAVRRQRRPRRSDARAQVHGAPPRRERRWSCPSSRREELGARRRRPPARRSRKRRRPLCLRPRTHRRHGSLKRCAATRSMSSKHARHVRFVSESF